MAAKVKKRKPNAKALRQKVFEIMGAQELETHLLIANMAAVVRWIEDGITRDKEGRPVLKAVPKTDAA
jgi:hypothetical protein